MAAWIQDMINCQLVRNASGTLTLQRLWNRFIRPTGADLDVTGTLAAAATATLSTTLQNKLIYVRWRNNTANSDARLALEFNTAAVAHTLILAGQGLTTIDNVFTFFYDEAHTNMRVTNQSANTITYYVSGTPAELADCTMATIPSSSTIANFSDLISLIRATFVNKFMKRVFPLGKTGE